MTNASEKQNFDSERAFDSAATPEHVPSPAPAAGVPGIGIAAAAQEMGLAKDTLRVWERRYGFPQPMRSPGGERLYPQEQVTKLRLVKRLLDAGHRPSKILGQSIDVLQHLAKSAGVGRDASEAELDHLIALLRASAYDEFRFGVLKWATRDGLRRFVLDVAAPLSARFGNASAAGTLKSYHEHLFRETIQSTLRMLMDPLSEAVRGRGVRPRVLLTTLSSERHGLSTLMAEAMFTLAECECECLRLSWRTSLHHVVDAVAAHQIDIVALPFTATRAPQSIVNGLTELRKRLPPHVGVWVEGSTPALRRKFQDGVHHVAGLTLINETVAEWRRSTVQ